MTSFASTYIRDTEVWCVCLLLVCMYACIYACMCIWSHHKQCQEWQANMNKEITSGENHNDMARPVKLTWQFIPEFSFCFLHLQIHLCHLETNHSNKFAETKPYTNSLLSSTDPPPPPFFFCVPSVSDKNSNTVKFINLINTHSKQSIIHGTNYALLQVTTIMMITCLLCIIYILCMYILWPGQRGYRFSQTL